MTFQKFNEKIKQQFALMCEQPVLFRSKVTGDKLWDLYISNFASGDDPVFRDPNSTSHTCNNDKNFIRRYGNIVAIIDDKIVTMFDTVDIPTYISPAKAMEHELKENPVSDIFVESYDILNRLLNYESTNKTQIEYKLGFEKSNKIYTQAEADQFGVVTPGQVYTFYHFHTILPKKFVDFSGKSVEAVMSDHRSAKEVFKRGLDEISLDTLILVRDLIQQGSLLNGDSYLDKLKKFIEFATEYKNILPKDKDNWCWVKSHNLPFAKFRNELIGTLCVELTEGTELNKACLDWNKRVDPANYMKATAPISQRQIQEAKKFVEDNGYTESFDRRFATLDDINISEILHQNVGNGTVKQASMFDKVQPSVSTQHKRSQFDDIEEVSINKFMKDILPSCTSIEAFLENRFDGNLVALHTANNSDSKKAFKWSNNFGWTYNGNLAGKSQLAKMVEAKGGRVDGVFRFTHSWNELEPNKSLMDLHVFMPNCELPKQGSGGPNVSGRRVGWNNRQDRLSGGIQDVDYTFEAPNGYIPVENITFPDIAKMPEGKYVCMIHNWNFRGTGGRGKAEIECGGQVYQYEYPRTKHQEWVSVATVTLKNGQFTIEHHLPETASSKKMWNLDSNQFHKVNLVCQSPNFWGDNNTGNKHYMFMLEGCKSDIALRSFHTEFLNSDLLEHRKVMEVLGETTKLEPTANQLCGLGFNATINDELILKLSGSHKRTIKIKF